MNTVTVRFLPEVWMHDYAMPVEVEEPNEFQIPEQDAKDENGDWLPSHDDASDHLREHDNAPDWVKYWPGPFEIEIIHE